jgi:5S rRNA maturation endonuclease (ribonuclease M5)
MELILKATGLTGKEKGDKSILCPLHDDGSASGSINFEKEVFYCHAGCGGYSFERLEKELAARAGGSDGQVEGDEDSEGTPQVVVAGQPSLPPPTVMSEGELVDLGSAYLQGRGLDLDRLVAGDYGVAVTVQADDPTSQLYGYVVFDQGSDRYVGRNILDETRPKYLNSLGPKLRLELGEDDGHSPIWVVEGIFDALALRHLGIGPVVPILGSQVNEAWAYALRGRSVFLLLDADYRGWKASTEIAETLTEVGANPITLEMDPEMGTDPADALVRDEAGFDDWLRETLAQYAPNDTSYVAQLVTASEPLPMIATNIPSWDAMLGGGFKPGVHVIGAEPKAGKSSLVLNLTTHAVEHQGKTGLYLTYEIPKRQSWVRVASQQDPTPWNDLEVDPSRMQPETVEWLTAIASRMRIEAGWTVQQIAHAAEDFDIIVVDYLQRMPAKYKREMLRHSIGENISELSNIARDMGKVIIVVSSLPRAEYGRVTPASFKESGDIEYVVQSATGLINYQAQSKLMGNVVLNTRGETGEFWLDRDLGHLRFTEGDDPRGKGMAKL